MFLYDFKLERTKYYSLVHVESRVNPLAFKSAEGITHIYWGFTSYVTEDYFFTMPPLKNADFLYLSFSLINRPSFENIIKVSKF